MNKGGTTMKNQMEMFADGGLKDDGTTKDPVSGNDVPSGSLAEEVRDDIPAQLSEGEYVVPADVVRFYGVKFFEDLRMDAKMGLANMERNGRIGGEPVAVAMIATSSENEELSPEEEDMIKKVTGAASGGLMGYAPGGLQDQTEQQFLAAQSAPSAALQGYGYVGQSLFGAPKSSGAATEASTPKTFYHPDGRIQVVQFTNGSPQQGMEGFTVPPWSATKPSDATSDDDNEREDRPAKLLDASITYMKDGEEFTDKMTAQDKAALEASAAKVGKDVAEYYAYPLSTRIALLGKKFKEGPDGENNSAEIDKIIEDSKEDGFLDGLINLGKKVFSATPAGFFINSIIDASKEKIPTIIKTESGSSNNKKDKPNKIGTDSTIKKAESGISTISAGVTRKTGTGTDELADNFKEGGLLTKPKRKPKKPRGKGLASK